METIFPSPPSTFCTVCKFMCTFEYPVSIPWMSPFVASRIQSDWLPSYLPGEHWNGSFALGAFSVQSVVNRILGLVPPDPCAMPQFHVVRTSGISQTWLHSASRTNAATSHFKLNQVIETWITSSIPYPWPPVAGLQDWATSPNNCAGSGNWTQDAEHVKLWHYTWANPPTFTFTATLKWAFFYVFGAYARGDCLFRFLKGKIMRSSNQCFPFTSSKRILPIFGA